MQSSSQLFPVQLISAELVGSVVEDVYLLKPNNSSDHTVQLAVTRVSNKDENHSGQPLVLLHGLFSSCRQWLAADGKGVAACLVDAGYDVWMPELRGHGLSPVNKAFLNNSIDSIVNHDMPAIQKFIVEQTGKSVAWVGDGFGGFLISSALALATIDQKTVSCFIYIEEQVPLRRALSTKVFSNKALWRFKKQGLVSGRDLGLGSENESYYVVKEYLRWHRTHSCVRPSGLPLDEGCPTVRVPVLFVGSEEHTKNSGYLRRSKYLFEQIVSTPKMFREYDYQLAQRGLQYDDGGVTVFPVKSGLWDDVTNWLEGRYDSFSSDSDNNR